EQLHRRATADEVARREQESLQIAGMLRSVALRVEEVRATGGPHVVAAQAVFHDEPGDLPTRAALRDRDLDDGALRPVDERVYGRPVAHVAAKVVDAGLQVPSPARQRGAHLEEEAVRHNAVALEDVADLPHPGPPRDRHRDGAVPRAGERLEERDEEPRQHGQHDHRDQGPEPSTASPTLRAPRPAALALPPRRAQLAHRSSCTGRARRGSVHASVRVADDSSQSSRRCAAARESSSAAPPDRIARLVVSRSSYSSTGTPATRLSLPANERVAAACSPSSPASVSGNPTTTSSAPVSRTSSTSSSSPAGVSGRSTLRSGVASEPLGSDTADPQRAAP